MYCMGPPCECARTAAYIHVDYRRVRREGAGVRATHSLRGDRHWCDFQVKVHCRFIADSLHYDADSLHRRSRHTQTYDADDCHSHKSSAEYNHVLSVETISTVNGTAALNRKQTDGGRTEASQELECIRTCCSRAAAKRCEREAEPEQCRRRR